MKQRLLIIFLLTMFIIVECTFGQKAGTRQQPPAETKNQRQSNAEIEVLITDARTAPAEFAADALMRIAELGKSTARKRELLEEAFYKAADAQNPFKLRYVGGEVDTRAGYLADAFGLNLDALSLKSKGIKAMSAVDKQKARQLLGEISPEFKLPPLGCRDSLVYDTSTFYVTLKEVAREAFSDQEMHDGLHVQLVLPYVNAMTHHSQVGPVADNITALKTSPSQLAMLVHAFSGALKDIPQDDRSFSYSMTHYSTTERLQMLAAECAKRNVSRRELSEAIRAYLVSNLSAGRCADTVADKWRSFNDPNHLSYINKNFAFEIPISTDEIKPARVEGRSEPHPYWTTSEAAELLKRAKRLKYGAPDSSLTGAEMTAVRKPLTDAEKTDQDWRLNVSKLLDGLNLWNADKEGSEADLFHQKRVLYTALLKQVPASPERDDIINAYVEFLKRDNMQREKRVEWFLYVNQLTRLLKGDERSKVLEKLSNSGNIVLRLHAALEQSQLRNTKQEARSTKNPY